MMTRHTTEKADTCIRHIRQIHVLPEVWGAAVVDDEERQIRHMTYIRQIRHMTYIRQIRHTIYT